MKHDHPESHLSPQLTGMPRTARSASLPLCIPSQRSRLVRLSWRGWEPPRSAAQGGAGTLAAGAALQDDDRRLAKLLGTAAGGAQLAQVGVRLGVAAAHRLAAGTHAQTGLCAPSYCGGGRHPEGHYALQPLAAGTLLQAAHCTLERAAHLAAAARVADAATLAVRGWRGAAGRIAVLRTDSGSGGRAADPRRQRQRGSRQQQQ